MVTVHRLVATAFLGPQPPDKPHVAHNDGDPANNRLGNLRYASKAENAQDKPLHGTDNRGSKHPNSTLTDEAVRDIRASYAAGEHYKLIAARHGIHPMSVYKFTSGTRWKHLD